MRSTPRSRALLILALVLTGPVLCLIASDAVAQDSAAIDTSRIGTTRMVEVDGHTMRVWMAGLEERAPGEAVVVFETGRSPLRAWSAVLHDVARFAPVVAYDRAGRGWSEWDGESPTPDHVTGKLHRLLVAIGAEPPYVMAGMDWGALLALAYADRHPEEVVGLALMDPWPIPASIETALEETGDAETSLESYGRHLRVQAEPWPAGVRREMNVIANWLARGGGFAAPPDVPVAVVVAQHDYRPHAPEVTNATPWDDKAFHEKEQRHRLAELREWTLASPEGTFTVTNASNGYPVPLGEPELAIRSIRSVVFPDITKQILAAMQNEGVVAAIELYHAAKPRYPADRFTSHLLMQAGYLRIGEDTDAVIRLFELNVEEYPGDPYAHFALGEAYAEAERMEEARSHFQAAVRLGEKIGDSALSEFRAALDSVGERLRTEREELESR